MSAIIMNNSRFDVVEYIRKLRNAGVTQEIAEASNKTIIWIDSLLLASGLIQHFFK